MRGIIVSSVVLACLFSCSTNTGTGALVGGGGGALIGGLAGGWQGAAIGGAAGAILGGLIGNSMDEKQRQENQEKVDKDYPGLSKKLINNEPLNTQDVIHLSSQDIPPEQIIEYLNESKSQFSLTRQDCRTLCRKGVNNQVVLHMSNGAWGCNNS
ncbi:MAG: glycine zipper domain-containing protein [Chlamydiia bacterium]